MVAAVAGAFKAGLGLGLGLRSHAGDRDGNHQVGERERGREGGRE
jgi:hypothetical protein